MSAPFWTRRTWFAEVALLAAVGCASGVSERDEPDASAGPGPGADRTGGMEEHGGDGGSASLDGTGAGGTAGAAAGGAALGGAAAGGAALGGAAADGAALGGAAAGGAAAGPAAPGGQAGGGEGPPAATGGTAGGPGAGAACSKPRAGAPFPRFAVHEMGTWGNKLGQTSLVDVDKDGDLDFVSGTRAGQLSWWEHRPGGPWVRHVLGSGHTTDVGGVAVDVDRDGWVDQVSGDSWFRNLRNGSFERRVYGGIASHDTRAGDLDGDGVPEIIALSDRQATIAIYKIPAGGQGTWPSVRFGSTVHAGLALGDLDGDGDVDLVRGTVWYENRNGRGTTWTEHALPYAGARATAAGVGDLDGDGDADVAVSDHDGGRVSWIENLDGKGGSWRERPLATGKRLLHSLLVADFDNDCDLDVYAGETVGAQFVWENTDGRGSFRERVIATDVPGHETRVGDVDGDGDLDLAAKPWDGGRHVYLRNLLVP